MSSTATLLEERLQREIMSALLRPTEVIAKSMSLNSPQTNFQAKLPVCLLLFRRWCRQILQREQLYHLLQRKLPLRPLLSRNKVASSTAEASLSSPPVQPTSATASPPHTTTPTTPQVTSTDLPPYTSLELVLPLHTSKSTTPQVTWTPAAPHVTETVPIPPFSYLTPQLPLSLSSPPWSILHWCLHAMPLDFAMLTLPGTMGGLASLFIWLSTRRMGLRLNRPLLCV